MKKQENDSRVIPMPLFQQLKESIRSKILDGTYAPHHKLPSEREMTVTFSVSRITVRQALSELQREGLVFKINGKGTFVSMPKARFDVSQLKGFGESAASIGQEAISKLISVTNEIPTELVRNKLDINRNSLATKIKRLRYLNREPLAFDFTHTSISLGERISSADLEKRDIFDILENDCGIYIASAKVNVEAIICDEELAKYLAISEGTAVLHVERAILDEKQNTILYENLYYRGDRFKFGLSVERDHLT